MKNSKRIVGVIVGVGVLGWFSIVHAEPVGNEPEGKAEPPIAVRIIEATGCAKSGIRLRVEIMNNRETPYRFSVCTGRIVCCVEDMFVLVEHGDTGVGLLDARRATDKTERGEVLLVGGAVYSFPMTIPLDRLPEDCRVPGMSLGIKLGFLTEDAISVNSEKTTLVLTASSP